MDTLDPFEEDEEIIEENENAKKKKNENEDGDGSQKTKFLFDPISNEISEVDVVFNFIERLPVFFNNLIDPKNSNFLEQINKLEIEGVNATSFKGALQEASQEIKHALLIISRHRKLDQLAKKNEIEYEYLAKFRDIGLTGLSLRLKANLLNGLWKRIVDYSNRFHEGFIDFTKKPLVKLLRNFLGLLNSILGSISQILLFVEPTKEIKDITEAIINVTDAVDDPNINNSNDEKEIETPEPDWPD